MFSFGIRNKVSKHFFFASLDSYYIKDAVENEGLSLFCLGSCQGLGSHPGMSRSRQKSCGSLLKSTKSQGNIGQESFYFALPLRRIMKNSFSPSLEDNDRVPPNGLEIPRRPQISKFHYLLVCPSIWQPSFPTKTHRDHRALLGLLTPW